MVIHRAFLRPRRDLKLEFPSTFRSSPWKAEQYGSASSTFVQEAELRVPYPKPRSDNLRFQQSEERSCAHKSHKAFVQTAEARSIAGNPRAGPRQASDRR